MKCYYASFNVGNVEAWGSDLFLHKKWVIIDVEKSIDEIVEYISKFSYLDEIKITEAINQAIIKFKQEQDYRDKKMTLIFSYLNSLFGRIYKREKYLQKNIKIDDDTK